MHKSTSTGTSDTSSVSRLFSEFSAKMIHSTRQGILSHLSLSSPRWQKAVRQTTSRPI
jgi:hypothetical protein